LAGGQDYTGKSNEKKIATKITGIVWKIHVRKIHILVAHIFLVYAMYFSYFLFCLFFSGLISIV
jgi:hypothetical protein